MIEYFKSYRFVNFVNSNQNEQIFASSVYDVNSWKLTIGHFALTFTLLENFEVYINEINGYTLLYINMK